MPVTIVPTTADHLVSLHQTLDTVARESRFLSFLEAPSFESFRTFVLDALIAKDNPAFVALDGETVVGWCDITRMTRETNGHCGTLGMGVLASYHGQGVGSGLIRATMAAARARGIVRIELTVNAGNSRGITLYERVGFVREGLRRDANCIDGVFADVWMMAAIDRSAAVA